MAKKKEKINSMEICAAKVREVSCKKCLHYQKCIANGGSLSRLALFLNWLQNETLPPIEAELNQFCIKGLRLDAYAPNADEMHEGAYAVVRAHDKTPNQRLIFRLSLLGDEDAATLKTMIFNAYITAKRNLYHGTK